MSYEKLVGSGMNNLNKGEKMEKHIINGKNVITCWKCLDCNDTAEVDVTWFQDNGTPYCPACDMDMQYENTYLVS